MTQSLSDQAEEFRLAQGMNGAINRLMQKHLIDEEYKEFCEAHATQAD